MNYHTLADFRVEKQQELDELFTQVLGALSKEGLITLEQVMLRNCGRMQGSFLESSEDWACHEFDVLCSVTYKVIDLT